MQPEQVIIADWMKRVMEARGWSALAWAKAARVDPTTITRAIAPGYASVTSVKTLDVLAKAAGELSVLDFLQGDAHRQGTATTINEEAIGRLLSAVLPLVPKGRTTAQSLRVLSAAVAHGLELLGHHPSTQDDDGAIAVAARGAVSRFRDLTRQ